MLISGALGDYQFGEKTLHTPLVEIQDSLLLCPVKAFPHMCSSTLVKPEYPFLRLPVLLCAVKTVEGDFRFCWMISPNVGKTHKENPNLVRIFYMTFTLNDIYKQYNKLHEH